MKLFESFESRVLLSGNVAVKITDSQVRFIGDAAANALSIVYSRTDNQLVITGSNGTTIDGKSSRVYAARDNVSVTLNDGDDLVSIQRFSGGFNVGVDLGAGNDAVYFKRSNILAADFFGGTGNDTLDITDSTFSRRLRAFPGEQDDVTALRNVRARAGLDITDTAGNTVVAMDQVSASDTSWFSGSNRRDALRITGSDFNAFSAKLKHGNDGAYIRGTTFAQTSPIDGGTGTNDINREVILSWDFGNGDSQGWFVELLGRDPADYGAPVSQEEFAESQSAQETGSYGMSPIPESTALTGSSFRLYMLDTVYLAHRITSGDGLLPNKTYTSAITTTIAAGGDGSASYKAGTLPVYPNISSLGGGGQNPEDRLVGVEGGERIYLLSFAGTNRATENVVSGTGATPPLTKRSNRPTTVTTRETGEAWIVFEAAANAGPFNTAVAFRTFSVVMTPVQD